MTVSLKGMDWDLARDQQCHICKGIVPTTFKWLVGTPDCLCPECNEKAKQIDATISSEDEKKMAEDRMKKALRRRFERSGITRSVALTIGLNIHNQDPDLPGEGGIFDATRKFVECSRRGILCLSGHNGTGKSTAAAWASYRTRGRFIPRSEWSMISSFGDGGDDIKEITSIDGIVTLDEVCSLSSAPDTSASVRTVLMICCERADRHLGTIVTTRCTEKKVFDSIYGNDMLDRMLQFKDSGGSGWVTSTDKVSMRAKTDGKPK